MELCEKYNLDVMDINPRLIKASPLLQKRIDEVHELIIEESRGVIWTFPHTSTTTGGDVWTSGSTYTGTTSGTTSGSNTTFTTCTTSGDTITQWSGDSKLRLMVDGNGNISAYSIDEEELE